MGDYHVHLHPHGPYTGHGPPPGEYPDGHVEAFVETAVKRAVNSSHSTSSFMRGVATVTSVG